LSPSVGELVAEGRLENVPVDPEAAANMLAEAVRHLDSAATITRTDPNGAYQLLYDAARKGVAAHMLAHGLRARNRQGAHQAVVLYAEEALAGCRDVRYMDRMRRSQNRSEYDIKVFGAAEVAAGLEHARAIVGAAAAGIGAGPGLAG
jgi:hypothetical protein